MPAPITHIEFRSSDFGRTNAFYAKVFDWQTEQNASATYMKLADGGGAVSGGWVRAEVSQAPGPLVYIAVDDLAAKLAEVADAGGRIIAAKLPFAGGGEIGLFADPDGNVIGLWAPKDKPAGGATKPAAKPAATAASAPAPAPKAKSADKKPKADKKKT